ncbi:MAG: putative Na+/H+ antiporter [Acidobacteriota bacterium]
MTDSIVPLPLSAYPATGDSLVETLIARAHIAPFNLLATAIFLLAIIHTFIAPRFARLAHQMQHEHNLRARAEGRAERPSVRAEILHFLGEVEVVFGLWAAVLLVAIAAYAGWHGAVVYFDGTVNYTEPMFVVVIMALASTRPIVGFAESALRRVAGLGGGTPKAWWITILIVGPLLGSFVTEPAAMTICALLLGRQFYERQPSERLKYATLGLLFVNVSVGGTLTHFAAPPVLMVARPWNWDLAFMWTHIGWRAVIGILLSTGLYALMFRSELNRLGARPLASEDPDPLDTETPDAPLLPVPAWLTALHVAFMAWTVVTAHSPSLFIGGFLFFLGVAKATSAYQGPIELKTPLLVGFFLAGLVIHGGLQAWWIAPVLGRLDEVPLFLAATGLTAFNDNALITYLATLVPDMTDPLKLAVVRGAVLGGGLTVIANAPNPAGQALLARYFGGAVSPLWLLAAAAGPTFVTGLIFLLI